MINRRTGDHAEVGRYFCRNTITIDARGRDNLAAYLGAHIAAATGPLADGMPSCNLYISGSLGRGEPSFDLSGPRPALASDVDFVAVGHGEEPPLAALEAQLSELFPEIRDTLYFLPAVSIWKLFSASAVDMTKGMARPILERFPLPRPPVPAIGVTEMIEVVVYQVAGVLSSTRTEAEVGGVRFWQLPPDYQALKAMVDMMRAVAVKVGGEATLASAYALRNHRTFADVFTPATVETAAEARESWRGCSPFDLEDISNALRRLLRALLPYQPSDLAALVTGYRAALYRERNILHLFPIAVLIEGLLPSASEHDARSLLAMRLSVCDDLVSIGSLTGSFSEEDHLSASAELKLAYIREMIARKDRGGSIWHWEPIGGGLRCERQLASTR